MHLNHQTAFLLDLDLNETNINTAHGCVLTWNFSEAGSENAGIVVFMPQVTAGTLSNHNLRVGPWADVKRLTLHFWKPLAGFLSSPLLYHSNWHSFMALLFLFLDIMHRIDVQPAQSHWTNLTVLFDKCSLQLGMSEMQSKNNYAIFWEQYGAGKNHFRFSQVKCNDHS